MTSTPPSAMALVLVGSLIGSIGMVFLKKASKDLHHSFWNIVNMDFVIGAGLFVLSSLIYITGIRHGQISVLYPMASLSYVWALVWARLFFAEPFTRNKLAGLALVLVGVSMVSLGG